MASHARLYPMHQCCIESNKGSLRGADGPGIVVVAAAPGSAAGTDLDAVLDGTEVLYLCKEDQPTLGIQLASSIGARLPSHLTAVGKACLAWLEADCLPGHVDLATRGADGQTISLPNLTAELAQVRGQGFATDDGGAAAGIQGVAAPVFGLTGLKGAIGVSLLRGSAPSLDPVAGDVKTAAARATIALGGTTPNHHVLPRNDHADQTNVACR